MLERRTAIVEVCEVAAPCTYTIEARNTPDDEPSIGSAVLVDPQGHLLTNYHVVGRLKSVLAFDADGNGQPGVVLFSDPDHDLAVVQVMEHGNRFLPLAMVSLVRGETVIALGSPYGWRNSASAGIVSALGRTVPMPNGTPIEDAIQHTAAINPGNSGGPLLNVLGELVGINVAVRDGAQGIAFAINVCTVVGLLADRLASMKAAQTAMLAAAQQADQTA